MQSPRIFEIYVLFIIYLKLTKTYNKIAMLFHGCNKHTDWRQLTDLKFIQLKEVMIKLKKKLKDQKTKEQIVSSVQSQQ